jgi:hypothetical protein
MELVVGFSAMVFTKYRTQSGREQTLGLVATLIGTCHGLGMLAMITFPDVLACHR